MMKFFHPQLKIFPERTSNRLSSETRELLLNKQLLTNHKQNCKRSHKHSLRKRSVSHFTENMKRNFQDSNDFNDRWRVVNYDFDENYPLMTGDNKFMADLPSSSSNKVSSRIDGGNYWKIFDERNKGKSSKQNRVNNFVDDRTKEKSSKKNRGSNFFEDEEKSVKKSRGSNVGPGMGGSAIHEPLGSVVVQKFATEPGPQTAVVGSTAVLPCR